jgi:hypothetical protein
MMVLKEIGFRSEKLDFAQWDPEQKEVTDREVQKRPMHAADKVPADQKALRADVLAAISDPRPSLSTPDVLHQFDEDASDDAASAGVGVR